METHYAIIKQKCRESSDSPQEPTAGCCVLSHRSGNTSLIASIVSAYKINEDDRRGNS